MPDGLRCQVVVTAGVVPGTPMKEYTRAWYWTDSDQEKMRQTEDVELHKHYVWKWIALQGESREYAASLENPGLLNWVHRDWMWM